MKYMLDIALVVGFLWVGYLWNGEKQIGLALSDEMDTLKAQIAQVQLDLGKAKEEGVKMAADLDVARAQLDQTGKDLISQTDAFTAKSAEADKLRTDLVAAVARIKELEGYKAKAIVAEMPKPIQSAP